MTLPVLDHTPEGVEGAAYKVGPYCAVPGCRRTVDHVHHLVRRSAHGRPRSWIRLSDKRVVGNLVGLCHQHHHDLTSPIGGHRNAIRWIFGRFWWCKVISDGRGGVDYDPLDPLDPQPPTPESLRGSATEEDEGADVCPTCGRTTREARPAGGMPGEPARPRKTWTVTVPADSEDGAEVLDTLVDDLAPVLGYESSPHLRYFTLARVLVFAQQSKRELLAAMEGR